MSWDERQRAMLAEMGYRLPAATAVAEAVDVLEAEPEPIVVAAPPPVVVRVSAPAAPSSFAHLDLPALREAVSGCRACGLCEQRRNAVFGNGALQQAQWLVVTDPPDEGDDAAGEAFGGPGSDSGRLLERMLTAAGQQRSGDGATAFVTPIVKCRPPRGRPPQPAELDACEAVLARQAELLRPRLVLAMGLQAARRLTGSTEPLGKLRGRVHRWRDLPVVVTYHPAYLLRSPADKAGAWDDLRLAMRSVGQS